jgi:DNA invertase Pin-like site-specific DNA recombinase
LTDVQACRIREMRLKGAGYRAIATATGLSRDSVRNYCKNNGINGFGEVAKLNLQEQMKQGNKNIRVDTGIIQSKKKAEAGRQGV